MAKIKTAATAAARRPKTRIRDNGLPRKIGWKAPIREKVSPYADKGFLFEVRFWCFHPIMEQAKARDAALAQMKRTTNCRVVGPSVRYHCRIPEATHRLYLRTEADLLVLRMLCDDLFRIYRLVSRKAA